MKKGIIAISLLLSGALLITPITNASTGKTESKPVKVDQVARTENVEASNKANDKTTQTEEVKEPVKEEVKKEELIKEPTKQEVKKEEEEVKAPAKEEVKKEEATKPSTEDATTEDKDELVETGMSKSAAEAVLNNYLTNVEKVNFTYVYQGDENTFEAMQQKGIRGYVFLPNVDTDMAYLVDKDNGSIYFFHPSGYFEQLQ